MPTPSVADRAKGYGIPGIVMDGTDAVLCYKAAQHAAGHVRSGQGPVLLEAKVVRLTSHSSDDDQRRYRTTEDLEDDKKHDCIGIFRARLEETGVLSQADAEEMRSEIVQEIDRATTDAENAPDPEPESAMRHVLAEGE
jgi:2-oxoisovalerate dehydrogenase E1 component alpha subunit